MTQKVDPTTAVVRAARALPAAGWEHIDTTGLPPDATLATAVGPLSVRALRQLERALRRIPNDA